MHKFIVEKNLEKTISKLEKKDKNLYEQLKKKIKEIIESYTLEHYKNLRQNLKDYKRVHIGSFVLIFRVDKNRNLVIFEDFAHHDKIYRKK